jgi:hypothetical protein
VLSRNPVVVFEVAGCRIKDFRHDEQNAIYEYCVETVDNYAMSFPAVGMIVRAEIYFIY